MEEERIYTLMMESLDGVLDEAESAEFDYLLTQNPDLAEEWEAMQAVDELFRFAEPAPCPVHLAQMTLARLPNPRNRRIFTAIFFVALLVGGMIPILFGLAISSQLGGVSVGLGGTFAVLEATFGGLFAATRSIVLSQPYALSWIAALVGVIMLWLTVYRRAVNDVQFVPVAVGTR